MSTTARRLAREAVGPWWLFVVTGVLWILLSLAILQFDVASVAAISILFGVVALVAGLNEFLTAVLTKSWRWAHVALGVLFVAGAVVAFVWPGPTFVTLARVLGWFLLFKGTFDVVLSLAVRVDLWWLRLITGALEIALAFWAVSYTGRAAVLLVLWVGFGAMMRGITEIVLAFSVRSAADRIGDTAEAMVETADRSTWPGNVPGARSSHSMADQPISHSAADQSPPAPQRDRPEG